MDYFYCDTKDFKEMLIEYKNDRKKMYLYVMEALTSGHFEHGQEDDKLMKELGVLTKVHDHKYQPNKDPEELERLYREFMVKERVGAWPPNPYGINGQDFSFFGRTGSKITYPLGKPDHTWC
ncbi:hypothetical protein MKX03_025001 [Papaver bracteatum]|nr:hypothetical protein MKX03_025001 [Papaver bracteatum]